MGAGAVGHRRDCRLGARELGLWQSIQAKPASRVGLTQTIGLMKALLTIVTFLVATPGSVLAACDLEAARELSERHMAALLSGNCEELLTDLSAPPSWIRVCRRGLQPPNTDEKVEFARRTTFQFSRLIQSGPYSMAVGVLQGPDPDVFDSILTSQMFCNAEWTSYRPAGQECGVDWSAIPVKEYEGAVPLACENKQWKVRELE